MDVLHDGMLNARVLLICGFRPEFSMMIDTGCMDSYSNLWYHLRGTEGLERETRVYFAFKQVSISTI